MNTILGLKIKKIPRSGIMVPAVYSSMGREGLAAFSGRQ